MKFEKNNTLLCTLVLCCLYLRSFLGTKNFVRFSINCTAFVYLQKNIIMEHTHSLRSLCVFDGHTIGYVHKTIVVDDQIYKSDVS